jgi:hypothetical protein
MKKLDGGNTLLLQDFYISFIVLVVHAGNRVLVLAVKDKPGL